MATADLLGYADRLSVRASERIGFMVSAAAPSYRAELVRLDRGPDTPGEPSAATPISGLGGEYQGRPQPIHPGSYVVVPSSAALQNLEGLTIQLWLRPTLPATGSSQGICSHASDGPAGWALWLDGEGRLSFRAGEPNGAPVAGQAPLPQRGTWFFVAASYDAATGTTRLVSRELRQAWLPAESETVVEQRPSAALAPGDAPLLIGALQLHHDPHGGSFASGTFNGKIDRPRLWRRALSDEEIEALAAGADPLTIPDGLVAAWDSSREIGTTTIIDLSPNRLDGRTVNAPTRGVTGANWDGSVVSFRLDPSHYCAIAFHQDDLDDAGWEEDFSFDVPPDLPSGVYAARLSAGAAREEIPFYVRPAAGAPTAPILFLAPTNTYLAYANERLFASPEIAVEKMTDASVESWPWEEVLLARPELGASCYDRHPDGSGIAYSSRLRPVVTMRSDFVLFMTSDTRHFSSDLYLVEWLQRLGFPYDVATDEDLHLEGRALLASYKVVLTGSHPEYWTAPMLDALEGYLAGGGRLMYLGGNGFYWVTAIDPARPHLIEVRRGLAGTRCWESAPGESDLSLSGEPGGIWRHRGRAPQRLTGVGFAAEGWGGAAGYRRLPDSFRPEAAFIFEGVGDEETIGDFGLVMGGAAGDEIDRYDLRLGTPPETLRLATSEGAHSDYYQLVVEDVLLMLPGLGGTEHPDVRADLTYLPLPNGGAVFSVGSINWTGSLPHDGFDNNVSRITGNVLRRFADLDR